MYCFLDVIASALHRRNSESDPMCSLVLQNCQALYVRLEWSACRRLDKTEGEIWLDTVGLALDNTRTRRDWSFSNGHGWNCYPLHDHRSYSRSAAKSRRSLDNETVDRLVVSNPVKELHTRAVSKSCYRLAIEPGLQLFHAHAGPLAYPTKCHLEYVDIEVGRSISCTLLVHILSFAD